MIPFGTKAETLEKLAPLLKSAKVLPQVRIDSEEYQRNKELAIEQVKQRGWIKSVLN